jgi:hypothetical protein
VLTDQLASQQPGSAPPASPGPATPAALLAAQLRGIPGVQGVVVVRADPQLTIPAAFHNLGVTSAGTSPVPAGVVSCAQLATAPALGHCPAGATAAAFPADGFAGHLYGVDATAITWPAANVRATRLDTLAVDAINVAIGTGFGATAMYASLEMQHPMAAPGAAYYLITAGGILAALGIIAATFPLLARITGPEVARNE